MAHTLLTPKKGRKGRVAMKAHSDRHIGLWVLLSTILASSMAFIDGSALNVALDALQRNFGATGAQLLWVVNAYLLSLASLILLGGSLGDKYGRKRIFGIGIAVFAASSFVCGISQSVDFLIAARVVQGVGGALMVPGSLALISASFPPERRGSAIGTWSSFSTLTTLTGPALGGVLASLGLWRFVFFINMPLAVISLLALSHVPESRDETSSRELDIPGTVLVALGLGGLTYGAIELGSTATGNAAVGVVCLILGFAGLVAFVFVEARSPHPMVSLSLFRSRTFTGTNAMTAFLYGALSGVFFFFPLVLIQAQGYSAAIAGLTTLPFTIILTVMSPIMGRLVDKIGPRILLTIGPALVAVGFLLLALPGVSNVSSYWLTYFPAIIVVGLGMGITVTPLTTAVMGSVATQHAGIASGINNAVTRSAQVLALAGLGAVVLAVFSSMLTTRLGPLGLPADAAHSIIAGASKLGNTSVPSGLSHDMAAEVTSAIKVSFVGAFRVLALIGVGMALVSASLSWLLVQPLASAKAAAAPQAA
jgi:EmrB/QacA subfamily drug resistance transporter